MPTGATFEQRVEWHRRHALARACRKPSPAIAAGLARRAGDPACEPDA